MSNTTKSTPAQIRQRFDNDVERFSNLQTGQSAQIDSPLILDLISSSAAATNPTATHLLDVGCGAGNYTLKLLQLLPNLNLTLIDLSQPMLDRALPLPIPPPPLRRLRHNPPPPQKQLLRPLRPPQTLMISLSPSPGTPGEGRGRALLNPGTIYKSLPSPGKSSAAAATNPSLSQ